MHPNEALINRFYTAFQEKNYAGMQECYAEQARFSDPVFTNLDAAEVKAMWEMLVKRGKDLRIRFFDVQADDFQGSAQWVANYSFSATGKKVENHIRANFRFQNGKIIQHTDDFSFPKWSKQALGILGVLLGRTSFFHHKVQNKAMEGLRDFMKNRRPES